MKNWHSVILVLLAVSSLYFLYTRPVSTPDFDQWKVEYGMAFTPEQEEYRKMIFFHHLKEINAHNADPKQTYQKGVNQFTHLTKAEFAEMFLSSVYSGQPSKNSNVKEVVSTEPLMEIDWQALGKVSAVKDQGVCDAGYAFCSAALIESFYLFDNRNVSLSEQQIIDCSANYTTFGCGGGSRIGTINYIREKGLTDSIQYPYRGVKNNCQRPDGGENKPAYTHLEHQGCAALQTGLYTSPLTVAVNAKDWQSYKSGIFDGCTSTEVNHDTYLIGVTAGFWRIKNSWGLKWGEYGFIRLKAGNTCGICEKPGFGFKK